MVSKLPIWELNTVSTYRKKNKQSNGDFQEFRFSGLLKKLVVEILNKKFIGNTLQCIQTWTYFLSKGLDYLKATSQELTHE